MLDWATDEPTKALRAILGPPPTTPWSAIIPQILLWCFRRYCITALTSVPACHSMLDNLWEDHLELVDRYGVPGIQNRSDLWLHPNHVPLVTTPLEEYNEFFIDVLASMDVALNSDDEIIQDKIGIFLDDDLPSILAAWLGPDLYQFFIFPRTEKEEGGLSETTMYQLLQKIIRFVPRRPLLPSKSIPPAPSATPSPPPASPPSSPAPSPPPSPPLQPLVLLPLSYPHPIEIPVAKSIRTAFHRRNTTLRAHRNTTPTRGLRTHQGSRRAKRGRAEIKAA
jgi:hypothetical protein